MLADDILLLLFHTRETPLPRSTEFSRGTVRPDFHVHSRNRFSLATDTQHPIFFIRSSSSRHAYRIHKVAHSATQTMARSDPRLSHIALKDIDIKLKFSSGFQ